MARKKILNSLGQQVFRPPRGRKEVWLPAWSLTFLRTPKLPPNMAQFIVPLSMNKLDLKDYLFHAYGIPALAIRSTVHQHPVRQKENAAYWHRPRSTKRMTVEMDTSYRGGPFVWPEEPKDLGAWDKSIFDAAKKLREDQRDEQRRYGPGKGREQPGLFDEQVKALKNGEQTWQPTWLEQGNRKAQQLGTGTPWDTAKQLQGRAPSSPAS